MKQPFDPARPISEARVISYASMYLPVSMALLPVGLYVLAFYAELGIPRYAMSAIIPGARLADAFTNPLIAASLLWLACLYSVVPAALNWRVRPLGLTDRQDSAGTAPDAATGGVVTEKCAAATLHPAPCAAVFLWAWHTASRGLGWHGPGRQAVRVPRSAEPRPRLEETST